MIFNWNGPISDTIFQKLVEVVNDLKEHQNIALYLNTIGGDLEVAEALIYLINSDPNRFLLIGNGKLWSAGFLIFYRAKCDRVLLPGITGMAHSINVTVGMNQLKKPYYEIDRANVECIALQKAWTDELFKQLGLSAAQIKKINSGEELFFQEKEMRRFLKKTTVSE